MGISSRARVRRGPLGQRPLSTPNASILRTPGDRASASGLGDAGARPSVPGRDAHGRPGAYLALGSIGLPLAGPRVAVAGPSREPRGYWPGWAVGAGSLAVLLFGLLMAGAVLVGMMAGPLASLPFV
ncbi:MAG: hypothetical protein WKF75_13505 [Singulisphaera sp.]